jgi:hypothetical protein
MTIDPDILKQMSQQERSEYLRAWQEEADRHIPAPRPALISSKSIDNTLARKIEVAADRCDRIIVEGKDHVYTYADAISDSYRNLLWSRENPTHIVDAKSSASKIGMHRNNAEEMADIFQKEFEALETIVQAINGKRFADYQELFGRTYEEIAAGSRQCTKRYFAQARQENKYLTSITGIGIQGQYDEIHKRFLAYHKREDELRYQHYAMHLFAHFLDAVAEASTYSIHWAEEHHWYGISREIPEVSQFKKLRSKVLEECSWRQ